MASQIDAFLNSPEARIFKNEDERRIHAERNRAILYEIQHRLLSLPAAKPFVSVWDKEVRSNESGFAVVGKDETVKFKSYFPKIETAIETIRTGNKKARAKALNEIRNLSSVLIVDSRRLTDLQAHIRSICSQLAAAEARIDRLSEKSAERDMYGYLVNRQIKKPQQGDLFLGGSIPHFQEALGELIRLRSIAGMPLSDLQATSDSIDALMSQYLAARQEFFSRLARPIMTVIRQKARQLKIPQLDFEMHKDEIFAEVGVDCMPILDRYDPSSPTLLSYLSNHILATVRRWWLSRNCMLKTDDKTVKAQRKYFYLIQKAKAEGLPPPSEEELAKILKSSVSRLRALVLAADTTTSLHEPIGNSEDGGTLEDTLVSTGLNPEESMAEPEMTAKVRELLDEAVATRLISPLQFRIISRMFGLDGSVYMRKEIAALEEVDENGKPLTTARIGILQKNAFNAMRNHPKFMSMLSSIGVDVDDEPESADWSDWERGLVSEFSSLLSASEDTLAKIKQVKNFRSTPAINTDIPRFDNDDDAWIAGVPMASFALSTVKHPRIAA